VDFGSGERRRHCEHQTVVEHVDHKFTSSKCLCGSRIVTFMSNFKSEDVDTFLAINSFQNNSVSFQNACLNKIKRFGWGFLIAIPVKLNRNENDPGDTIFQLWPTVEMVQYDSCRFYRFDFEKGVVRNGIEVLVSPCGDPVDQRRDGSFRYVACVGYSGNSVYGVSKDSGPLDFLAAGHIRYGESLIRAMSREWREEMVSPVPKFRLLGRVDSLNNKDITFVFIAEIADPVCIKSRGRVIKLVNSSWLRYSFAMSSEMWRFLSKWNFNIDSVLRFSLRGKMKDVNYGKKRKLVDKEVGIRNAIDQIKVFKNGGWLQVNVLRKIDVLDSLIYLEEVDCPHRFDQVCALFMGVPMAMARYQTTTGGRLIYKVFEILGCHDIVVARFRIVDLTKYENPHLVVMQLYNVDRQKADRMIRANFGQIPLFLGPDGASTDWSSMGRFSD